MRRWLALALLLTACVTADPKPRMISVEVYETTPRNGGAVRISGQHLLRVQVHNESDEAITINSISFAPPAASGGMQIVNGDNQRVTAVLEPTETKSFGLWVAVRSSSADAAMTIDSVRVTIGGRATHDFVDSNVYQVIPE